jgi:hypothetical protein
MDVNTRTIGNEPPVKRANQASPQPVRSPACPRAGERRRTTLAHQLARLALATGTAESLILTELVPSPAAGPYSVPGDGRNMATLRPNARN